MNARRKKKYRRIQRVVSQIKSGRGGCVNDLFWLASALGVTPFFLINPNPVQSGGHMDTRAGILTKSE